MALTGGIRSDRGSRRPRRTGKKKADQQTILDDFNKRGFGIFESPVTAQAIQVAHVAASSVPPPMATPASPAVIASREDVLSLTEAAKDGVSENFSVPRIYKLSGSIRLYHFLLFYIVHFVRINR
ncbi:hypothetical protein L6452_33073 [Arctium lappa]|uniref:Uncharacterized protein n=1 Tax=Arctium lappa TaxID=4217 RepID=A0ACB8Z6Y7_ARCLA|nr:hypothetical protein L6452_33073 [Arctium lappa]